MKKVKWMVIAVILIGFTLAVQWSMGEEDNATKKLEVFQNPTAEEVGLPDNIKQAETREDVDKFFESRSRGYTKAKEMELIINPNQSFEIPEHEGELTIDEVWYSQHQVFMYYSVDLHVFEGKDNLSTRSLFNISNINLTASEGDLPTQSHSGFNSGQSSEHLITYDGKLYGLTMMPPLGQQNQDTEINETALTSFQIEMAGETQKTEEQPIKYTYESGQEILQSAELQSTYKKDGLSIEPKQIELGITNNRITFEITHDEYEVANLHGTISEGDSSRDIAFIIQNRENPALYESSFFPFFENPESLQLDIDRVTMLTEEGYSFEVDVSDYEEVIDDDWSRERVEVDEKVAELYNTDVYLEEKVYDPSGNSEMRLSFEPHSDNTIHLSSEPIHIPNQDYRRNLKVFSDGEEAPHPPSMVFDEENSIISLSPRLIEDSESLLFEFDKTSISQEIELEEEIELTK
ncbi:hypothetical protein [Halobacillus seohaensis]|uniref:Uncharacterized protein n=1 Tax=Halobacillus seohaensis TaxID=447421 RepID=A0ABW2EKP1_9BACI